MAVTSSHGQKDRELVRSHTAWWQSRFQHAWAREASTRLPAPGCETLVSWLRGALGVGCQSVTPCHMEAAALLLSLGSSSLCPHMVATSYLSSPSSMVEQMLTRSYLPVTTVQFWHLLRRLDPPLIQGLWFGRRGVEVSPVPILAKATPAREGPSVCRHLSASGGARRQRRTHGQGQGHV